MLKQKLIQRVLSLGLILVLIYCHMTPIVLAEETQTVSFSLGTLSAQRGEFVSIPVYISSSTASPITFGGISLGLSYDSGRLKYTDNSAQIKITEMSDATINHQPSKSNINIVWFSGSTITVGSPALLCTLQFLVLDGAAVGDAVITLTVKSLYSFKLVSGNAVWEDLNLTSHTAQGIVSVSATSSQVQSVMNAITEIGVVTPTDACLAKINAALAAYAVLSTGQKSQVSNYQTLLNAQVEYDRLKNAAAEAAVQQEIQRFQQNNALALALTVDTVTIGNEQAVASAYEAFNKLSVAARYEIFYCNEQLKNLTTKISALKKSESDRLEAEKLEKKLRAEAQDLVAAFREEKDYFLKLTLSQVEADHYEGLNDSIMTLNMLSGMNPYVGELLVNERNLLQTLLKRAEDLVVEQGKEGSVAVIAANRFRRNFSWLLSQTISTIGGADLSDIRLALEVYKLQDNDTMTLLTGENTLLNQLLAQAQLLDEKENSGKQTGVTSEGEKTPPEQEIDKEVTAPGGVVETVVKTVAAVKQEMGSTVWMLFVLWGISLIIFGMLQLFKHFYLLSGTGRIDPTLHK